jgi:CheY-like chemotaxis protein
MPIVLIVDDEQHIRLFIEQTLEELEDEAIASGAPLSSGGRPDDDSSPAR